MLLVTSMRILASLFTLILFAALTTLDPRFSSRSTKGAQSASTLATMRSCVALMLSK